MRTEKPSEPQEPNNNRRTRTGKPKPKRQANGPLGFGAVMRDVKGGSPLQNQSIAEPSAASVLAAQLNAGAQAAQAQSSGPSAQDVLDDAAFGVQDAAEAQVEQDNSVRHILQKEAAVPTNLGKMTPSALLKAVVSEATKHAIAEAAKELHVELEPAHLGPLVVRLMRGDDGRLDVRFRAREGEAARMLDAGSDLLRDQLADAGYAQARVQVEHDADLVLSTR